jgi:hypothetical protein
MIGNRSVVFGQIFTYIYVVFYANSTIAVLAISSSINHQHQTYITDIHGHQWDSTVSIRGNAISAEYATLYARLLTISLLVEGRPSLSAPHRHAAPCSHESPKNTSSWR